MELRMSRPDYTKRTKKRRNRALLPVMGLSLAVLLGVAAYFLAPILIELGENQSPDLKDSFDQIRNNDTYPEGILEIMISIVLWLVMMGLAMFLVAATVGEDPEKEPFRYMGPPPSDKKAQIKELKKELRAAKKRERQRKK
jgi:hypothetical protein